MVSYLKPFITTLILESMLLCQINSDSEPSSEMSVRVRNKFVSGSHWNEGEYMYSRDFPSKQKIPSGLSGDLNTYHYFWQLPPPTSKQRFSCHQTMVT